MGTKKNLYLLLLLICGVAFAQSDTIPSATPLSEVRISSFHVNDSLLRAPASIGMLAERQLTRNNNADISIPINTISGVYMQSANMVTNRISIRGIGARTPYGTNKIRAFYGNIPLTSGDSETTIDDINLENISQIEIIKGPLSSVYGAGLGGAILLSPKLSGNGKSVAASSTIGSYGLVKNNLSFATGDKKSSLNLNYHNLQTDGWRENSAYNREGVTLGGELFRKPKSKLTYFGNYTWLKTFIPSSIDKKTFDENPKVAATTWLASKGYKLYRSAFGGLGYEFALGKIRNATSIFVNYKDNYETRPFDVLHQYTLAYGARTQFSGGFKIATIPSDFIFGMEYFNDDYHGRTLQNLYKQNGNFGSLEGDLLTANSQKRNFYNAFAQLRLQFTKQLELQGGINVNQTHFDLDDTYPKTSSQQYDYDAIVSPQVSLLFKPSELQTIYASISKGYSLPSVSETLTASGTINANIKPENGYNYEIGGKFYFLDKAFYAEIALYRMEIKDLLVAKRIGDDQYVGVNAGETLHQGVELSLNHLWAINRMMSLNWYASGSIGEYKFEDFNDSGTDFSDNKLTGVPANKANAGFTFKIKNWFVGGDFLYVDRIPLNDSNSVYADAYQTVNAKLGCELEIFKNLVSNFAFGINNITDEHYAALILPNALPVGNNTPRYYYPGLPVNYYGNISLHYTLN
jgi:iron complex outermembrane receptor protein